VQACGYKILITLLWLSVPAFTVYLARTDHDRYIVECARQRADCETRADVAGRYTSLFNQQAGTLLQTEAVMDYQAWDFTWNALQRQYEVEQGLLRTITPTHYPRTDTKLIVLEGLLASQQEQIALAATRHQQYIKAERGLMDLSDTISEVEAAAEYYERIHAEGIYLLLMEDLAKLEDRFSQLMQNRRQLHTEASGALRQADEDSRGILREMKHLPDELTQDEQTTYLEALWLRLERFDPWAELRSSFTIPVQP
jgi:hypothetical protein